MGDKVSPPAPGFYEGVPFDEYLKWDCFSKSMSGPALKSTAHLDAYLKEGISSPSLSLGSLVDCLVLEPETFDDNFVVAPETYVDGKGNEKKWDLRSSACRDERDRITRDGLLKMVSYSDMEIADIIKEKIQSKDCASRLLAGKKQVSAVYEDPDTGVICKVRYDCFNDGSTGETCIVDLKTTRDASPEDFKYSCHKFKYHVQAAMYSRAYEVLTGEPMPPFYFVAAETVSPYEVGVYCLREESLLAGAELARRAQEQYKLYKELGPRGYADEIVDIDLPMYAVARVLNEGENV